MASDSFQALGSGLNNDLPGFYLPEGSDFRFTEIPKYSQLDLQSTVDSNSSIQHPNLSNPNGYRIDTAFKDDVVRNNSKPESEAIPCPAPQALEILAHELTDGGLIHQGGNNSNAIGSESDRIGSKDPEAASAAVPSLQQETGNIVLCDLANKSLVHYERQSKVFGIDGNRVDATANGDVCRNSEPILAAVPLPLSSQAPHNSLRGVTSETLVVALQAWQRAINLGEEAQTMRDRRFLKLMGELQARKLIDQNWIWMVNFSDIERGRESGDGARGI